jgi:hypothetical protein
MVDAIQFILLAGSFLVGMYLVKDYKLRGDYMNYMIIVLVGFYALPYVMRLLEFGYLSFFGIFLYVLWQVKLLGVASMFTLKRFGFC